MNVLVVFFSETGNTRQVAEAIFAGLELVSKTLLSIDQAGELKGYDLIFCGFPVINHGVPEKVIHFLQRIPAGKKVAFFASHGSLRGGEKAVSAFFAAVSLTGKQKVLGTFGCRGQVKAQLIEALMDKFPHRVWAIEAQSAAGHPDVADLEDARAFAQQMFYKAEQV